MKPHLKCSTIHLFSGISRKLGLILIRFQSNSENCHQAGDAVKLLNMYLELFTKMLKVKATNVLGKFYLQFIGIQHVAKRPDGVNDGGDARGVVPQFSLYVHLVFFQQLHFLPHPSQELLTLSSQCFLPGLANIVDQLFLHLRNNVPDRNMLSWKLHLHASHGNKWLYFTDGSGELVNLTLIE